MDDRQITGAEQSLVGLSQNNVIVQDEEEQQANNLVVYQQNASVRFTNSPEYQQESDEIVQVVYQSTQNGSLIGVGSALLGGQSYDGVIYDSTLNNFDGHTSNLNDDVGSSLGTAHQQLSRATSSLPPVAEESSSGVGASYHRENPLDTCSLIDNSTWGSDSKTNTEQCNFDNSQLEDSIYVNQPSNALQHEQLQYYKEQLDGENQLNPSAIYSTINKHHQQEVNQLASSEYDLQNTAGQQQLASTTSNNKTYDAQSSTTTDDCSSFYTSFYTLPQKSGAICQSVNNTGSENSTLQTKHSAISEVDEINHNSLEGYGEEREKENTVGERDSIEGDLSEEISQILSRQKQGAAESGSLKNNFRKKLGVSVSTNETDLTTHRQKLLQSQEVNSADIEDAEEPSSLPKFKRTHSVSFNVNSSRASRHSVDIRNLPSYLTIKRASIVDVAKGAMSSLMHSFGSGAGSSIGSQRRDSSPDEEPIFEEPIAPTLSLGQRVALVKNSGAEFGTVGWIGQLPDIDDDWIVGVIFDNMIGNSDGTYNGVRYFYARENYVMFVPLSTLTKTDNYIGRPETGTMLSRMSVSLKPGQLISIQRSSIRLQHCFLNAPHQRVGHDVRAVSNRLHCQCHNCGPCAHLTKQGRISAIPPFGTHHAPNKKNSLAHAAVEILAHHHHHYHEEEHKEDDYQFGDNAAHACNFVRYSCCQQTGAAGHNFSDDCNMVRPELLDNLIHAPRAPHRRSRPRRQHRSNQLQQRQQKAVQNDFDKHNAYLNSGNNTQTTVDTADTIKSWPESEIVRDGSESSYSSCSSNSSFSNQEEDNYGSHINNVSPSYQQANSDYNTIDAQMSVMDQQRFIYQRDSSAFLRSHQSSDDTELESSGLASRMRRCFNCLIGRQQVRPKKKRKLSARNRMIEYRRKQFVFVPSTLAKPHEDFASHGIMLPDPNQTQPESNSDYSSYSKSSGSSRSHSPDNRRNGNQVLEDQSTRQQTMTLAHEVPTFSEQLKSSHTVQGDRLNQLNYEDFTYSDGYGSYKKNGYSCDSALTDLGYFDTWTNDGSNDTLKQIVEQTINEQAGLPEPIGRNEEIISPIISNDGSQSSELVDISSPTVSSVDHNEVEVCNGLECLNLNINNRGSSN